MIMMAKPKPTKIKAANGEIKDVGEIPVGKERFSIIQQKKKAERQKRVKK